MMNKDHILCSICQKRTFDVSIDLYEHREIVVTDTNRVMLCGQCYDEAGGNHKFFLSGKNLPFECIFCEKVVEEEFYAIAFVLDDTDNCDFVDLCLDCGDKIIGRDFFCYRKK